MGRRYVVVEVGVDQFDTEDLIEELESRGEYPIKGWTPENLDHKMKFELFLKHIDDYFYTEFEKRIAGETETDFDIIDGTDYPDKFIRL